MKDPIDILIRPYEVLGVPPDIPIPQVLPAYAAFLKDRRNMVRGQAGAVARDRLSRPERRIEDELFYYPTVEIESVGGAMKETPVFEHDAVAPSLKFDLGAMACSWKIDEDDFDSLSERTIQFSTVGLFEETALRCLPITFPN